MINPIEWTDEGVRMIDQRKLPTAEEYPVFKTYREIADAIRSMVVRGAPAIGVAAAMGVALGVRDSKARNISRLRIPNAKSYAHCGSNANRGGATYNHGTNGIRNFTICFENGIFLSRR